MPNKQKDRPRPTQNPILTRDQIVFGHPSEEEFARVLDFYRIKWRYETTTFPLQWDLNNNVTAPFPPISISRMRTSR